MSILSVQHVSYIYENTKQPVLKDISVDFEMGKLYSIKQPFSHYFPDWMHVRKEKFCMMERI